MKGRFFIPILLIALSCSDGKVDTSKVQEEMKAREVRVIPDGEILERAFQLGDSLLSTLDQSTALQKSWGIFKRWEVNDINIDCTIYTMKAVYNMPEKEQQVFDAYRYSAQNDLPAEPNVQKLPGEIVVYNAPLMQKDKIVGMWSIKLPKKYIILSMKD